jgi:endoglucanase
VNRRRLLLNPTLFVATIAACLALAACGGGTSPGPMEQAQLGAPTVTPSAANALPATAPAAGLTSVAAAPTLKLGSPSPATAPSLASSAPVQTPHIAPSASAPRPLTTLQRRMQLFRDGALHGFALAELPDSGAEIYTESDFQDLAATGANVVRVSIQLRKCDGCKRYEEPEADIRYVERILARGERYGFRVVVVLLATPWGDQSDYWGSDSLKADIVRKWGEVATRLRGFPALQAYDLINEPVVPNAPRASGLAQWQALAAAIVRELRKRDPDTPLLVEPMPWGLPSSFWQTAPLGTRGLVYSFHFYEPHEFTHQGLPGYPDPQAYPSIGLDKSQLSKSLDDARRFAADHDVPMFVGEFSCVRWAPDGSCPRYLADAISLFDAEGWGWAYHCWRCYQGWDAEVPQDVPMEQADGLLPEYRRSDSPSLKLLTTAMESNRKSAPN